MKIAELISILENKLKQHGNIEVEVTWESLWWVSMSINHDNIYKGKNGSLLIDADDNSYKLRYAENPFEE